MAAWTAARERGSAITMAEALALASEEAKPALSRSSKTGILSAREMEVAELISQGLSNSQIARRLVISDKTAANHVEHILTKLDVR